ncbi:hypothetical protein [Sphingobium sp. CCH11-B1]|jgi:hypothetical protein|uniref:hypothetical protein n=1 Tax=Sphingobium sp. CCH11-B1 TaxID=1768781 RepID=UPI00082FC5B9|nr:hypothetical protein [Sphingobium sp. CCH11-B1]MEA3388621.1 hypothetical protein [Pseudomonadota bacterium]
MRHDADRQVRQAADQDDRRGRLQDQPARHGVVFALVAVALLIAIAFFYLTGRDRRDRGADAVTHAAASVDRAASAMGDAAGNAAKDLRRAD